VSAFSSSGISATTHGQRSAPPGSSADRDDGDVDLQDLAILLASYGTDAGGDLDGDDDTDLLDLAILLAHYGYGV
jgi:hypothetical protein